jgi:DNA-binding XRE family transcriptional regulator
MSVTELSEKTNLNYNYICDLRNKRHLPNIYNALLIANYLNCHIDDIWYLKEKNNPE